MVRPELEKARVRLYEKADRRRVLLAVSTVLLLLFGFIAFLNVIGSVNISFREGQRNFDRFLNWLVIAILSFIGPYGFYLAKKNRDISQIGGRPPASRGAAGGAGRFGMPPGGGIAVSSGGGYGKLTPEIK